MLGCSKQRTYKKHYKSRQINSKPGFPYFEFDVKRLPRSVDIFQSCVLHGKNKNRQY